MRRSPKPGRPQARASDSPAPLTPPWLATASSSPTPSIGSPTGTVTNCRLEGLPSDGACDAWTQDPDGAPGLFARTHRPGEALRLSLVVDVRPWTGALQPSTPVGTVEQVVLLGGEGEEGCGRLGEGGGAMQSWDEVTACPVVTDAAAFFATLGDPRPRQATWSLTASPLPPRSD